MKGYMNRLAYVDLSRSTVDLRELPEEDAKKYVGGSGLAAKILYDETDGGTQPLGPDNRLIFMTGPFTGTRALSSSRYVVAAKSPLTGLFGESTSGGSWAEVLKRSGVDGIVIRGKASNPSYLWIKKGQMEIRNARHLWGKDTFETDAALKDETDEKAVVSCIGPAGEKMVPISAIVNDGIHARTAARCGFGAVMGSKNLKAVVVGGGMEVDVHDSAGLNNAIKTISKDVIEKTKALREFGTAGAVIASETLGGLPVQNWRYTGRWKENARKITGTTMLNSHGAGNYSCKRCIIGCGKDVIIKEGYYRGEKQAAPEYETLALLGSNCLIDNVEAIIKANDLCNRYGLDTMSTGGVIAFGMEAFEKDLITVEDTEGIDLRWGNESALIRTLIKIGENEGIGKLLGLGVKQAARALGNNAEEFAMHVKGLEFAAHDPRAYNAGALNFATSSIGASHLSGFSHAFERGLSAPEIGIPSPMDPFESEGKGALTAKTQNYMGMLDSLITCKFVLFGGVGISTLIEWYHYITGEPMDVETFIKTGERIFNLKRLYNIDCGVSRKDDFLPPRTLTLRKNGEGYTPNLPPIGKMLSDYYEYRGWSEEGFPTGKKLKELGIIKK